MSDWPPKRAAAFTVIFPIYDADGDLVAGATGLDSEVSKDGGTFTDVTPGEAAEIATASGMYSLALSIAEMTADIVATITTSNEGKPAVNVMYTATRQLIDLAFPVTSGRGILVETDNVIHADVKEWLATAPLALVSQRVQVEVDAYDAAVDFNATQKASVQTEVDSALATYDGVVPADLPTNFVSMGIEADGDVHGDIKEWLGAAPNALQSGRVDSYVGAFAAAVLDAAAIAADAIGAAEIADGAIDAATFAAGAIDAGAIAADAITSSELAQSAAIEIADEVLKRDLDQVEATMALHSLGTACLKAVSRIRDNAGTLETYETDGVTLHMSQTVTVDAGADPVDELTAGV